MFEDSGKKPSEMTMDENLLVKAGAMMSNEVGASQLENLTGLINNVKSNDPDLQLKASYVLGMILTGLNPPWQKVIEAKILRRFVHFLDREELPQLQHVAVGIISSFVEYFENITVLVDSGVVPGLVDLLNSPIDITRAMAITTLGNIAKESPERCELVLRNGALEPLLAQFNTTFDLQDTSWVLRQICNRKPQLKSNMVNQVLHVLEQHLHSSNEQILVDTCWTLASLCEVDTSRSQVVFNSGVCRKLIELLHHESPLIVEPALETMSNIASGDQKQIQHMIDFGMLPRLVRILLTKYDNNMKKNACKTISKIANNSRDHIKDVVGYGVVYVLADMFECSDIDIKMEVARAISIVTSHGTYEAVRFVSEKCVKPLCDMLDCSDSTLISKCLGGLESILKAWESESKTRDSKDVKIFLQKIKKIKGLKKIKILQYDDDTAVSDTAKEILDMYWLLYWDLGRVIKSTHTRLLAF